MPTPPPFRQWAVTRHSTSTAGPHRTPPTAVATATAAAAAAGLFVEQGPEAFARQMTVNYLGTVHTLQAALPGMLERRQGRVVVVASALAVLGFAGGCGVGVGWVRQGGERELPA